MSPGVIHRSHSPSGAGEGNRELIEAQTEPQRAQEDQVSPEHDEAIESVAIVARLLDHASLRYHQSGSDLTGAFLASGALLASEHALWLLPGESDPSAGPTPLAQDPVELVRAAEAVLDQLPGGAYTLVPGLAGLVADVCGLLRDCQAP